MGNWPLDKDLEKALDLAEQKGLDAFLDTVLEKGLRLVGTNQGSLMLIDSSERSLEILKRRGPAYNPKRKHRKFSLGEGIAGTVAETRSPFVTGDVESEGCFAQPLGRLNFHSLLVVPILHSGAVIGVLCADSPDRHKFCGEDVQRLESVAACVGGAFEKLSVNAYIMHVKQLAELETLHRVGQDVTRVTFQSPEKLTNTLQEIAREAELILGADIVTLYQYDQDTDSFITPPIRSGEFHHPEFMNGPIYRGDIPHQVVQLTQPTFTEDAQSTAILTPRREERPSPEDQREPFVVREEVVSSAGIPLTAGERAVGVMFVNYRIKHIFSDDDKRMICVFAADAAMAIEGARLVQAAIHAEEAKREATEMRARQDMAAIAVHNLNNPAAGVRWALHNIRDLIGQDHLDDARKRAIRESVDNALIQIDAILKTREAFLSFIRPSSSEPLEDTDLQKLVSGVLVQFQADSKIHFIVEIAQSLRRVRVHPVALQAALISLVQNAVEAVQELPEPTIRICADLANDQGVLTVADNGRGVPEGIRDKMFNAFVTTKALGTGLGLYAARKVMRTAGGDVLYDPGPQQGARFSIRFPCGQGEDQ